MKSFAGYRKTDARSRNQKKNKSPRFAYASGGIHIFGATMVLFLCSCIGAWYDGAVAANEKVRRGRASAVRVYRISSVEIWGVKT